MSFDPRVQQQVADHAYPLLFVTISGAHLYGFPSADSDYDLRGVHRLALENVVGLKTKDETVEKLEFVDGLEIDLVTHDLKKFFGLMLKKNGYVMEQVLSPLVVHAMPEHEELKEIARSCLTKHHAYHYLGFAANQWKLFQKEDPPRVKPLLYLYRVLLTGIHLMRTGVLEANLVELNEVFHLPYLPDLIDRKINGAEKETLKQDNLDQANLKFHEAEFHRLVGLLEAAHETSELPAEPSGAKQLNDLLVRLRIGD